MSAKIRYFKENSNDFWNLISKLCFFTFVLFLSAAGSNAQRAFRLVRERQIPGDDFLLPKGTPDCPRNGAVYVPLCSKYNAAPLGGCWCQCNKPADEYTFYEQSNGCVKASIARQKSGMRIPHSIGMYFYFSISL